jgi:hypothetical protein
MWAEAQAWFAAHRATLAAAGIPLAARLELDGGLLCTYDAGVIRLALPDPSLPGGDLRIGLLAQLLGIRAEQVVWLFGVQLARLIGHEIGHALRDEAGQRDPDPWREEQAAERLACLLARPHLSAQTRNQLRELLADIVARLGGVAEAIACHRLSDRVLELPELVGVCPCAPAADRYRDLPTFLRVSVAWSYFDVLLDPEDDFDDYRTELLVAG